MPGLVLPIQSTVSRVFLACFLSGRVHIPIQPERPKEDTGRRQGLPGQGWAGDSLTLPCAPGKPVPGRQCRAGGGRSSPEARRRAGESPCGLDGPTTVRPAPSQRASRAGDRRRRHARARGHSHLQRRTHHALSEERHHDRGSSSVCNRHGTAAPRIAPSLKPRTDVQTRTYRRPPQHGAIISSCSPEIRAVSTRPRTRIFAPLSQFRLAVAVSGVSRAMPFAPPPMRIAGHSDPSQACSTDSKTAPSEHDPAPDFVIKIRVETSAAAARNDRGFAPTRMACGLAQVFS
jgi:hypothetical protein